MNCCFILRTFLQQEYTEKSGKNQSQEIQEFNLLFRNYIKYFGKQEKSIIKYLFHGVHYISP